MNLRSPWAVQAVNGTEPRLVGESQTSAPRRDSHASRITVPAGDQGEFAVAVTIPSSTPAGTHHLVAVGSDGRQAEVAITVS